jgi:hypothetical protein
VRILVPSFIPGGGNGLQAKIFFACKALITGVDGRIISYEEAVVRRRAGTADHIRTLISHHLCVDGLSNHPAPRGAGGGTYANDGRGDPEHPTNAEFHEIWAFGTLRLCFLRATQDIFAGEEILVSYGKQYWAM